MYKSTQGKRRTYHDNLLYDKLIDERSGNDESPANTVLVLNNSLCDRFKDVKFGNRSKVGTRGMLCFAHVFFLLPRKPAASPMAQFDSLSFDRDV